MGYLSKFPIQILIADASKKPLEIEFKDNINYRYFPDSSLIERFRYFSKAVKTKYVLLSPDDDYFLPLGLQECITFLEANSQYSSAQGMRIRMIYTPSFRWIPHDTHQIKIKLHKLEDLERLHLMSSQSHYLYSVMRKEVFHKIIECFTNVNPTSRNSFAVHELVFNYSLPVFGNHAFIPSLYSARTYHLPEATDVVFSKWILDERDSESRQFRRNVQQLYEEKLKVPKRRAIELEIEVTKMLTKEFTDSENSENYIRDLLRFLLVKVKRNIERFPKLWRVLLLKPSYVRFFVRIFLAGKFGLFIQDKNSLFEYLDLPPTKRFLRTDLFL